MYNVSMAKRFHDERTYGIKVSVAPGSVARLGKGEAQTCSMSANVFVAGNLYLCQHPSQSENLSNRRCWLSGCWDGYRNDRRASDQIGFVLANHRELSHHPLEGGRHKFLLIDEALPRASSAGVASESEIGLEAHLPDIDTGAQRKR